MKRIIGKIVLLLCLASVPLAADVVTLPGLINPDSITQDSDRIYIRPGDGISLVIADCGVADAECAVLLGTDKVMI